MAIFGGNVCVFVQPSHPMGRRGAHIAKLELSLGNQIANFEFNPSPKILNFRLMREYAYSLFIACVELVGTSNSKTDLVEHVKENL